MKKRNLLRAALAGTLFKVWIPPLVTVVSLPVHATTTCTDITGREGIGIGSTCESDHFVFHLEIFLYSETQGDQDGHFTGETYSVHSDNSIQEVRWEVKNTYRLAIEIREPLPEGCEDGIYDGIITDLSPGNLIIETSCGLVSFRLGPV